MGVGRDGLTLHPFALAEARRLGRLAALTCVVALGTWSLLGIDRVSASLPAAQTARGSVTVSIDGLVGAAPSAGTVADSLRAAGLARGGADRVSAAGNAPVLAGARIALDRGLPVTLIDGGEALATRAPYGTVADLLEAERITLGPLDQVEPAAGAPVSAGTVVRVTRIAEREETVRETGPFPVRYIADPNLDRGVQIVVSPGQPAISASTYRVRTVDGREVERVLLASVEISGPVEEVRRSGVRAPVAAGDIEATIRDAAARQGADPDQLLRVAWCESRYNPNAVNPSGASGLFQFMPATWAANSVRAGFAGASVFDPAAAANVAAWMFARGSAGQWTCR